MTSSPLSLLTDLLLPQRCPGCGGASSGLCGGCHATMGAPRPHLPSPCPPGFPALVVAGRYEGPLRSAILAYKEHGRRSLAGPLATLLTGAIAELVASRGDVRVALVPIPSRRGTARRRGGDHVAALAFRAAALLAGTEVTVHRVLRVRGRPADSAGLDAAQRRDNIAGTFGVGPGRRPERNSAVVLVDDLVTTGATIEEATRVLATDGIDVIGAAALAGTARTGGNRGTNRRHGGPGLPVSVPQD